MGAEGSSLAGAEAALVDGEHNRSRGKVAQRRQHALEFKDAISAFNASAIASDENFQHGEAAAVGAAAGRIRVAVRKRPLFPHESAKGDFDTVCCAPGGVWMHRTMMRADLKHMVLESYDFAFPDGVFSEQQDTDAVFADAVAPLVSAAASRGGVSTIMCFGQTGSGKTYTTNGLAERVAKSVFDSLPAGGTAGVVCVEVAGTKVRDLLGGGTPVTLLEDSVGVVHAKDAVEVPTADAAALRAALADAQAGRAAAATGVHDASSRSHSVSRVILHDEAGAEVGRIDLVDLAGSEWAADREQHSTERQREGAEINSSLMCLKACMRTAMSAGGTDAGRMPYRQHALTKLLKDSFMGESEGGGDPFAISRTLLLATLSPSSADTEHSLSTLQHVAAIANSNSKAATTASVSSGGGTEG
jgi:kinesin family protein 2/24